MLAVQGQSHEITTVEGLASPQGHLHPVQVAFSEKHGLQCGFCTPGLLLATCELLAEDEDPSLDTVREQLSGNLCRCTGYIKIFEAVNYAATLMREGADQPDRSTVAGEEAP
jgi:carbon-monoxide dehydrogenase small subunit